MNPAFQGDEVAIERLSSPQSLHSKQGAGLSPESVPATAAQCGYVVKRCPESPAKHSANEVWVC